MPRYQIDWRGGEQPPEMHEGPYQLCRMAKDSDGRCIEVNEDWRATQEVDEWAAALEN
jgi:hypothetical protein